MKLNAESSAPDKESIIEISEPTLGEGGEKILPENCGGPEEGLSVEKVLPQGGMTTTSTMAIGAGNNPFSNVAVKGDEEEDSEAEGGPLSLRHSGAITKSRRKELVAFIAALSHKRFTTDEVNDVGLFINHFRKGLPCPKCGKTHAFASQSKLLNQFKGAASKTAGLKKGACSCSCFALLCHLPFEVIRALFLLQYRSSKEEADRFIRAINSSTHPSRKYVVERLRDFDSKIEAYKASSNVETPSAMQVDVAAYADDIPVVEVSDSDMSAPPIGRDDEIFSLTSENIKLNRLLREVTEERDRLRQANATLSKQLEVFKNIRDAEMLISKSEKNLAAARAASSTPSVSVGSFADAVAAGPRAPAIKRPKSAAASAAAPSSTPKPAFDVASFLEPQAKPVQDSELVFVLFADLPRRPMSDYRRFLDAIGFKSNLVRDIMFCSDRVVQFLTYSSVKDELIEKMKVAAPKAIHLENGDPCDPSHYNELGSLSREAIASKYFVALEASVNRFRKLVLTNKSLTRTLRFLERVLATKDIRYKRTPPPQRSYFMNSFFDCLSPPDPVPKAECEPNPVLVDMDTDSPQPAQC